MTKRTEFYAVVTGDIVGSTRFTITQRSHMLKVLKTSLSSIDEIFPGAVHAPFEIHRGDSFQGVLSRLEDALPVVIAVRAGLRWGFETRKRRKALDARIAVGIGSIDFLPNGRGTEGDGEAFMTDIIALLDSIISNAKLWTVGLSYIIVTWPAGVWIGRITEPWRKELDQQKFQGLAKAGLWMGRLERILILTFVLFDHYDAIGFLIAAKSILRFSEISSSKDRKEAEYILIGTLLSFVVAIFIGIFTTWILKQFRP